MYCTRNRFRFLKQKEREKKFIFFHILDKPQSDISTSHHHVFDIGISVFPLQIVHGENIRVEKNYTYFYVLKTNIIYIIRLVCKVQQYKLCVCVCVSVHITYKSYEIFYQTKEDTAKEMGKISDIFIYRKNSLMHFFRYG